MTQASTLVPTDATATAADVQADGVSRDARRGMHLVESHDAFLAALPPTGQPSWVASLRRAGLDAFRAQGLPTIRDENWRHTNVASIGRTQFLRAGAGEIAALDRDRLEPFFIPGCVELVFVNGRFTPDLSKLDDLPRNAFVGGLGEALAEDPDWLQRHLGQHGPIDGHPFAALNTAYLADGAVVHVPRGVVIEKPIHCLFVGLPADGEPVASYPRNLFVAEENSQVTIIETYAGFDDAPYFACPVTEIVGAPSSMIDHYKLQEESLGAFHMAQQFVDLRRSANFFSHSISYGGRLVRNDILGALREEHIECTLNGLYLARGQQHVDHHMWIDHIAPHCNSYELFKGVLEGRSRAVFNGRIYVHKGAQKTDAKQSNRNLLLSPDALVHSNPQLEIFADDVRCTHGSTTGHLDEQSLFYLRSRGIGVEAARSLLTYAFAAEVLGEIRLDAVREDVEEFLFTRLPRGEVVRQAV
ncbi:MAG: Fe-S cluster assembly protein SufD [Acidobacteriota bacterium]